MLLGSLPTLKTLKVKFKKIVENVIHFLFPLNAANSLIDNSCLELLFDKYDNVKSIIVNSFIFWIVFIVILTGYKVPILERYKPFSSFVSNGLQDLICATQSFTAIELVILRIWFFIMIWKHRSPENIQFVLMLKKLEQNDEKIILFSLQVATFILNFCAIFCHWLVLFLDFCYSDGPSFFIIFLVNSTGYFFLVRDACRGVLIMYAYSLAGFKIVNDQIKKLIYQVTVYPSAMNQVLYMYESLTTSAAQLTLLTKILMSTCNLLVVPTFSFIVILAITPTTSYFALIARVLIAVSGLVYLARGYYLVAVMSIIDSKSKKLYSNINSVIARDLCSNIEQVKRLNIILEDISCKKSRIIIHEYNSPINQMDVYNSIISTASTVALIISLTY